MSANWLKQNHRSRWFGLLAGAALLCVPNAGAAESSIDHPEDSRILVVPAPSETVAQTEARKQAAAADIRMLEGKLAVVESALNAPPPKSPQTIAQLQQAETLYRQAIEKAKARAGLVPASLTGDPEAARLSQARLDQLNERIARLQKALALLSDRDNSEWEKEWTGLAAEVRENADKQFWLGLDGLTAGLSNAATLAKARNLKLARQAVELPEWKNLAAERGQLQQLVSSNALLKGPAGDGIRKTISALDKLEKARNASDTAEAMAITRESLASMKEGYDQAQAIVKDPAAMNVLYRGSAQIGATASIFARTAAKEAALPFDLGFKAGEGGLLIKQAHEETQQMAALSQHSYDRHQKSLELQATLSDLEQERSRLQWAIQKAQ
jgi:hypothetical protein